MSEPAKAKFSNRRTILFMVVLSFFCALILSILASVLSGPKEDAKELDRSREMLKAARIYNSLGYFQIIGPDGQYVPAKVLPNGALEATDRKVIPSRDEVLRVFRVRMRPILVDDSGNVTTFEAAKIDEERYTNEHKKHGYANLPLKLAYEILPNPAPTATEAEIKSALESADRKVEGYVIPVSGFGLWDYIYGYIAIAPDGDTVIGISWYEQKETPGLGANIAEWEWQSQFLNKKIFTPSASGVTDYLKSSLGITVVRGKVKDVLGTGPKSMSAVDGMAGATLTGNGVTRAYKDTLSPYRPFLLKLHDAYAKEGK